MSKVRINDLAREMEVKSRQVLDALTELGLGDGKLTHSSSIEEHEAEKVRGHFGRGGARPGQASSASRAPQGIQTKVDLSHVHKPGDVVKALLARKQEEEEAARRSHAPMRPAAPPAKPAGSAGAANRPAGTVAPKPPATPTKRP